MAVVEVTNKAIQVLGGHGYCRDYVVERLFRDARGLTRMEDAVIEHEGFDLIVMGQPEGAGCYCAANSLLTRSLEQLGRNNPYLVMDNEAGMEHVSRFTTRNYDYDLQGKPAIYPHERKQAPICFHIAFSL